MRRFILLMAGLCLAFRGGIDRVAASALPSRPGALDDLRLGVRAQTDPRVRHYLSPQRVVWQSAETGGVVEHPERLLDPFSGQITLDNRTACTLRHQGRAPGILLDFGREL
jgi:alpha-L-rhamnosidase